MGISAPYSGMRQKRQYAFDKATRHHRKALNMAKSLKMKQHWQNALDKAKKHFDGEDPNFSDEDDWSNTESDESDDSDSEPTSEAPMCAAGSRRSIVDSSMVYGD